MNKYIFYFLPVYKDKFVFNSSIENIRKVLLLLVNDKVVSNYLFVGKIEGNKILFAKKNPSRNVSSEIVFKGNLVKINDNTSSINIIARYNITSIVGYIIFLALFILLVWPVESFYRLFIALLPYIVMVVRIKIKCRRILREFEFELLNLIR